jgi:hypothetical protein
MKWIGNILQNGGRMEYFFLFFGAKENIFHLIHPVNSKQKFFLRKALKKNFCGQSFKRNISIIAARC